MSVRLTKKILGLVDLVRRVYGYEHCAELGGRPKGDVPGGQIGRPDGYLRACLNAERDESSRESVDFLAELGVGASVVESGVFEAELIGELVGNSV